MSNAFDWKKLLWWALGLLGAALAVRFLLPPLLPFVFGLGLALAAERPVRTKERADVSTYYGEHAHVENCLVADGCFIEGTVTDCILFRGVRVARGAHLSRCIVMQDTCIAADAILQYVIADKNVRIGPAVTLTGCEALPIVIPKGSEL